MASLQLRRVWQLLMRRAGWRKPRMWSVVESSRDPGLTPPGSTGDSEKGTLQSSRSAGQIQELFEVSPFRAAPVAQTALKNDGSKVLRGASPFQWTCDPTCHNSATTKSWGVSKT